MEPGKAHVRLAEDRDGSRFRGGHKAIDLPATLQGRLKSSPRELLFTPHDLSRWLVSAGLAARLPATDESDLILARRLREAIYVLARAQQPDGADPSAAREILNTIACSPSAVPRLSADGAVQLLGPPASLLVTLARDAISLFGGEAATHIRQCQSSTCTLFFIDTSRSGDRKWCSMAGCGNKAKVAEFRRRNRQVAQPSSTTD
jgi:predicted RNA-binding Zn ribbon-like protein